MMGFGLDMGFDQFYKNASLLKKMEDLAKKRYFQHISDPSTFRLRGGEVVKNVHITATGSPIGRFLFTEWSPMIEIRSTPGEQITFIGESLFDGGGCAIRIL